MSSIIDTLSMIPAASEESDMNAANTAINQALAKQSPFYTTNATSDTAKNIQGAANALKHAHVYANWQAANQSANQLSNVGNAAAQMGFNGGQQGQAAIDTAQAAIANAGGGLGGLKAVGQTGAADATKAANVAQNEASNFLSQASTAKSAVSSAALQQAIVNAALTHANNQNALAANAIGLGVTNLQNSTSTQLNDAAMAAAQQQRGIQIQQQNAQANTGLQYLQGILSAAGAGAGAAYSALSSSNPTTSDIATPTLSGDANNLNDSGLSIGDLAQNQPDEANVPEYDMPDFAEQQATQNGQANAQAQLDQSLFSVPSNLYGVY